MITYTKRNVSLLALSLTIILFTTFHFIFNSYFFNQPNKLFSSYQLYSKTVPISSKKENNTIKNILNSQANLVKFLKQKETLKNSIINTHEFLAQENTIQEEVEVAETPQNQGTTQNKTQRQVVQENKNNKWRVQIPKLNIDVHINEGTSSNILLTSVGHFEETSKWNGNVGLAAHNRGYQCNFFQNIKKLKTGDEIIYTATNGKKVYRVQTNKVILETDWTYLEETQDNRITLITCEENRREYRRCIQAIEVANYMK